MSTSQEATLTSRYRGTMLGLAAGDALGTTLEFAVPGSFKPMTDMVGGGSFDLEPGQWTDDTSMALCLAESLVEQNGFDADDQMRRYQRWHLEGYLSNTGYCFDIGNTVRRALHRYAEQHHPFAGEVDFEFGGNGSLMRLAPIPLAFCNNPLQAVHLASEMSRTTHGAREPIDACRYYTTLIIGALRGSRKAQLLSDDYAPVAGLWQETPLIQSIQSIAAGSFKKKQPPEIRGTGYVVDALEAALWAFWNTENFKQGALAAVNLGDDADTTGAIYGQLAGAYYGVDCIPEHWRNSIAMADRIIELAAELLEFSINWQCA